MKSFKNYIEEAHSTWHVTFKTGHKPQKVKGRNTAEAIKKAEKRAQKSGEKDPRQLAMYKDIKKVSEEVEQIDEKASKIDRSLQDFHVNVPGHGMVLVKARSEAEANSKARAKFEKGDDRSDTFKEATAMTAAPKGSLGGIGKKPSMPAPGKKPSMPAPKDSKKINAPKGTARYHADMAARHQKMAMHHGDEAAKHEDDGNDNKADYHNDKMQHHDNAADAHKNAQDMIKKHGADHPEAQKASKEANKHKLNESVEQNKYESAELSEADIAEILRQYALSENVNADQLANLTEEEINEIIGKAIGKTFKYGAKAIVGGARLAKKGARAMSSQGRIDRANARKKAADLRYQRKKDSRSIFTAQGRKNRAADKAKADKINQAARDVEKKTNKGDFS